MPIDPSIALSIRPPQIENPLNAMLRVQQMKRSQQEDQMNALKIQEYQRQTQQQAAIRNALAQGDGSLDSLGRVATQYGDPALLSSVEQIRASRARTESSQASTKLSNLKVQRDRLAQVHDQASYDAFLQDNPGFANSYGAAYSPDIVMHGVMSADSFIKQNAPMSKAEQQKEQGRDSRAAASLAETSAQNAAMRGFRDREVAATEQRVRDATDPKVIADKARAKAQGEADVTASQKLPAAIEQANAGLDLIDQMIGSEDGKVKQHPGFEGYVGATWKPGMRLVEGSPEANFDALYKQVTGQAFLDAYETLKGGGQITEIEGQKATAARTRMSKAQSEAEFVKAAREFQGIVKNGITRAQVRLAKSGGKADSSARTVVRTGTSNGKKVVQYSDGTIEYVD